eukprot:Seg550.2 transcript_id=Seg550.2/GoldUCD/mRNA.D3Y31 product="hypothetical protein" protein_id=Seg550.2/GoldUCD/D3Y31
MEQESREIESDEDAPEDIQQSEAREVAQERQKQEREVIQQLKETKKNKRRKRQEKLIEQKGNKKAKLLSKLPDDILEILAAEDNKKETREDGYEANDDGDEERPSKVSNNGKQLKSSKGDHKSSEKKQKKKKKDPESSDEEFGDFEEDMLEEPEKNENVIKARVLKQKLKPEESKAKVGRDFLREQLYGNRIKRVSSTSLKNSHVLDCGAKPKAKF